MALALKIFGGKYPTSEEIGLKFAESAARRSSKLEEQSSIQGSIIELKQQIQDTLTENILSDDAGIS